MQFRILGPLEVVEQGSPRPLGGAKQRSVLAILILHRGELLPSERLVDHLWGERPPPTATKTLQGYVSRLRKTLGDDVLHTRGRGYALALGTGQLDVDEFERCADEGRHALWAGDAAAAAEHLRTALNLWRGPALADFAYEPFAQAEIARLEEARLATLEDRIEADLALGHQDGLVAELEARVFENPLRERLRGQLMLTLYRCGRQAEALECYRFGRGILINELGIEPGRALQDLETAILRHDEALNPPRRDAAAAATGAGEARQRQPEGAILTEDVVGRGDQIEQLRNGLATALDGRGVVFMVGGEAGIGKTRLADELARDARTRGAQVVWGRCWEAGGAPAYWPWVQVLRSLLHGRDDLDLRSFRGAGANSLMALVPELRISSGEVAVSAADSEGARFQLFDAVGWLLRESAGGRPVVVVLDDLHAADTPSLLLLQFLAGQLEGARLLLVGLYRDQDYGEDGALRACLTGLAREQATQRMRLTGLSVDDTKSLIHAITGRQVPPSIAQMIHAETEGNPLFVGEIVRLLEAEGRLERPTDEPRGGLHLPDTIREVIGQRLRRLAPGSRRLLSAASVLGREFSLRELAAVAEIDEAAAFEALDEAISARVLADAPVVGRLRFAHALVRDTLYEALSAASRRAAHLRAGEILEALHASDPEPHLAELAHHFVEALPGGDPGQAVAYAQQAGDHAVALLAYEEAARQYALALRALELQPESDTAEKRTALLVSLGDAWARAGDEPAARATFLHAGEVAARSGLPVLQAQAALGYGGRFVWSRAYNDVHLIPLLEAALQALPAGASPLRVRLMARLAGALRDHPNRERRASLSAQAVEIARGLDDPNTLAYVLDGRYSAIMWPETCQQRLAIADEIVALAGGVSDGERATAGRVYRVIANMELGRMAEAEAELEIIGEAAAALRQPAQLWLTAASRANLALFHGSFEEAKALIAEAVTLGERAQRRDSVLSHRLQLFVLHREIGLDRETEVLISSAVSEFPTRPVFRCALAYIQAALGDRSRAQTAIRDLAAGDFAVIQRDNEYLFSLGFVADAVGLTGDVGAAAVLYDLLAPYAHLNAINADEVGTGSVSRTLGLLAGTMSRWDDACRYFDDAVVRNAEMGARPWSAHSQHDYGQTLLARAAPGDRERAHQLLTSAREEYERLGMTPWVSKVTRLLEADQR